MGNIRVIYRLGILFLSGLILVCAGVADNPENQEINSLQNQGDLPSFADGCLLVRSSVSTDGSVQSLSAAHAAVGARVTHDYATEGIPGLFLVSLPKNMTVSEGVTYYSGQPGVTYAEPDYYRYMYGVPTDPDFWRQWGLENTGQIYLNNTTPGIPGVDIKAPSAWNITTSGGSTIAAVIDTGVDYNHPDLSANIWTDPSTGMHGYDTLTGTLDPMDQNIHGTHCAGIIGAVANNGIGGSGVAWNVTILPVRFLNGDGYGKTSDEITAISWAILHGAKVISCSFGSGSYSQSEQDIIKKSNALFIIAAGNEETDNNIVPRYPASYNLSNIISVASLAPNDTLSWFSNYGNRTVHLAAPGSSIFSTIRSSYTPVPVWSEPFSTLSNWTTSGNWTLNSSMYVSPPSSLEGYASNAPAIVTLNTTLRVSQLKRPVLSYYLSRPESVSIHLQGSVDGGKSWIDIDSYLGKPRNSSFSFRQVPLPDDLRNDNLMIRFNIENGRMLVDDLMLSDGYGTLTEPKWEYLNGTSMATPMVAGVAALLSGYAPEASITDIKTAILSSVDIVPNLQNKLITSGRVNLTAALNAIHPSPPSQEIPLTPGWNHISIPRYLANGSDTAQIFAGVNSSGHSVMEYMNDTAGYRTLTSSDPIQPLQGYWLFSGNVTRVPVRFAKQVICPSRKVSAGWSSIGGWADRDVSANRTLKSLGSNWSYLIGYNTTTQQYDEPIIRNGGGNQSDSRPVHPFYGYWLYCSQNGTYHGPDMETF